MLTRAPYPEALFAAILRQIRMERDIRHVKTATIKAILIRNHNKEISTILEFDRPEGAYQLGRLVACLERAKEDALPGLNAALIDRYFGAASATPATVFPRLVRMNQHHIGKLDGGKKVVAEIRIQEIARRVDTFPSHLGLTLVKAVVAMHGGDVEVISEGLGRGSEFRVRLPLSRKMPPQPLAPRAPASIQRIVVVEDIPDAREMLQGILEMMGYEVSAAEACKWLSRAAFYCANGIWTAL